MLEPSACQRATVSCGACCGIFNPELDAAGRRRLLLERTRAFAAVQFHEPSTYVNYRREREELEQNIPRRNDETYVCPFFGYLPADESPEPAPDTRAGCMIHPSRTGLEHSQNFSFYGASICKDYDCACKEKDEDQIYSRFLEEHFPGEEYGRLMGDVLLYSALEKIPDFPRFLAADAAESRRAEALKDVLKARLRVPESRGITSFDIKFRWFEHLEDELLHLLGANAAQASSESIRVLVKKLA